MNRAQWNAEAARSLYLDPRNRIPLGGGEWITRVVPPVDSALPYDEARAMSLADESTIDAVLAERPESFPVGVLMEMGLNRLDWLRYHSVRGPRSLREIFALEALECRAEIWAVLDRVHAELARRGVTQGPDGRWIDREGKEI